MELLKTLAFTLTGILSAGFAGCSDNEENIIRPVIPTGPETEPAVGEVMPGWREGYFEIHSISSGRGEANLYIYPDGTSLLIDAAGSLVTQQICDDKSAGGVTPARPGWHISSTDVIADYITHYNPRGANVDYYLNSHFHEDHMGSWPEKYDEYADFPKHPQGNFYLNGIAGLGTKIKFDKIIDRGYTLPVTMGTEDRIKDYQRFLKWTMSTNGTMYEKALPGHDDQIVMKYNPGKYPQFKTRILCASGYAWTGNGTETRRTIPVLREDITKASPDENIYSVALQIDYGNFNLYTAGDLQHEHRTGYEWMDAEEQIVPVVGEVEVMKASHHGSTNANSVNLINKLRPQTVWVNPWRTEQPGAPAVQRMVNANPDVNIFCTNIDEGSKAPLAPYADNFKCWNGHVVMRVYPDGHYMVYVLDDNDQNYKVKSIFGPYQSK